MNEIFLGCILIVALLSLYFSNKHSEKLGLIIVMITANVLSFILTFKYITISTLNINANVITYVTMFTAIYLLLEKHPKKTINSIINLNFIINIITALLLFIMSYYTQSLNDTIGINMTNVFQVNYRILIIYPITILISQKILLLIYEKVKKLYDNIFISMVTTYLAVGLIEVIIYTFISYYKILSTSTIIKLLLSTYMVRLIITVIYSIFLTITSSLKKVKQWVT